MTATESAEALTSSAGAAASFATPKDETSQNLSRWSKRWSDNFIGWHITDVNPVLLEHGHKIGLPPPPAVGRIDGGEGASCPSDENETKDETRRIFVPLCGKTVDLAYLASTGGVEVVGVEGVSKALDEFATENPGLEIKMEENGSSAGALPFERRTGKNLLLLRGDYFDLTLDATNGKFDAVWDRASLVAVQPELRESYVDVIGRLLKPGGTVLLLTFDKREGTDEARAGGPPFSVNEDEVRRLYERADWVESVTKVAEYDEFRDEKTRERWTAKGVTAAFEICFLITAKQQ